MLKNINTVVILNNVRSNENVGSIFRTADAAGVSKIYLVGYTPAPIDKYGRKNSSLAKSALGAEESVAWEKGRTLKRIIERLKTENYKIVAVEQDKTSKDYKKFKYSAKTTLVFGNEVTGLSKKDLSLCYKVVEIPMKGKKESLNISVAVGIILFNM